MFDDDSDFDVGGIVFVVVAGCRRRRAFTVVFLVVPVFVVIDSDGV